MYRLDLVNSRETGVADCAQMKWSRSPGVFRTEDLLFTCHLTNVYGIVKSLVQNAYDDKECLL